MKRDCAATGRRRVREDTTHVKRATAELKRATKRLETDRKRLEKCFTKKAHPKSLPRTPWDR